MNFIISLQNIEKFKYLLAFWVWDIDTRLVKAGNVASLL